LKSYLGEQYLEKLVRHQIESYNDFITRQMGKTINMFNPVTIHSENDFVIETKQYFLVVQIRFENVKLNSPQIHENNGATKVMLPQEARLRNFTYASNMTVDLHIKYTIRNTENMDEPKIIEKILPRINIGKMPIMLKSTICMLNQPAYRLPEVSGECPYDCGGYFIIKGSEKTVLGQERAAENRIYCFDGKASTKWNWVAEIKSVPDHKCISPKQVEMMISSKTNGIYVSVTRIKHPIELFVLFRAYGILSDNEICKHILLELRQESQEINSSVNELLNSLRVSIIEASKYVTQEDAQKHIANHVAYTPINMDKDAGQQKKREFLADVLANDIFPHCHTTEQKHYLLGYMARKLLETSKGWARPDDRDSYLNKRIDLTGTLLNNLFRNYFNKLVKEMQKLVVREINQRKMRMTEDYENIINMTNVYKIVKSTTIETGITRALSTGDFSIKQSNSSKVGVGQVLNRLTNPATISHLRRVNTPLEKSGELIEPRKLHNTTWGFLCPAETPEGQSIGVVKNIAQMAHITIPTNSSALYEYVKPFTVEFNTPTFNELFLEGTEEGTKEGTEEEGTKKGKRKDVLSTCVKVIINGCWVGLTNKPMELYDDLKNKKHSGIINIYTSVIFDYKKAEIRMCNDGGRLVRPVLRIQENKLLLNSEIVRRIETKDLVWNDLLINCNIPDSVLEYIDPEEQNYSMIAMKLAMMKPDVIPKGVSYTHCEIHPSTIYGALASCIPFPDSNPATRNTYQCAMIKQAIGVYATNFDQRMDKTAYVMVYPSRPLTETRFMNYIHMDKVPSGCQIHVAIMTHTGYNQEDSVLISQGAIDRGMFSATIYHTEKDEDKNITRDEIIRCQPDKTKTKCIKYGNYDKLNFHGFIPENKLVENRDILIAKIVPIKENRNDPSKTIKYEDQSKIYKTTEESYVDKNYTGRNGDGYNFAKTRVRILRKPVIGDKFASKHAQKGTNGCIIPECDMPFTKNGLKPDIILNPHAIPSRMTIGQLKETLLGKVLVELGYFGDATAFNSLDVSTISKTLLDLGYESYGNEIMYNGLTGEQLESSIFIGPCYYQRLKHMVNDKQHSRAFGPMVNLTRQPAEGRARDGGFRIGEMERDCMIAHGISQFCRERLYDASDKYSVHVCKCCGMIASYNNGDNARLNKVNDNFTVHKCNTCDNTTDFALVEIPYAYKLLSQELQTINIVPRILTE